MQMLRFRGGSAASPSSLSRKDRDASPRSDPLKPSPSPSPSLVTSSSMPSVTPGSVGPARPLRLVYRDEKGKFRMDPEAVATLQLVKGPIGVVSVCGRARQGKSFILNQLLGRSSGFQVASTHRPCTKGLWMWSAPIKRTAIDGTEYNLLLLDSEGIDAYDQTGTYSTQIFSLAVLLSSMFIHNQVKITYMKTESSGTRLAFLKEMGGIDEAALDRLSLVTEMTKHIRVRSTGGRSTSSELGQFSPVFVWLLRDFYLDLVEDNHKISPRDYLELALRPMQGGGKDLSARNEIRESIRSLFPDRECFTLVRPVNKENDLQRLDQIPLNRLRPEFRSGLDALTKFVFERTRPKQVGSAVMTGPILAGITQSFLDAINNGAVPTISSSWQSVEEAECRRSYDYAVEVYMSSFGRTKPAEEAILREAHEDAVQKSLAAFNASAVGSGSARMNYERLLHNFFRKAYELHQVIFNITCRTLEYISIGEDYKRTAFLEADLQCSNTIHSMENKLRAACHVPSMKLDSVIQVLESLLSEYESSSHGPGKWKMLSSFLRQCLGGPILDLFNKQLDQMESERSALALKCHSNDDKLGLLKKQLEANEKHRAEYLKRYEEAISDKQKFSEEYNSRIANLQSKCSTLEERCMSVAKDLDLARQESSDWKDKYGQSSLEMKAEEDRFKAKLAAQESRLSAAEGRLAAAREQAESAQEEASEWKRKYAVAAGEAKTALERAALVQERTNKKAQEREDALRAELSAQLVEKEEEIRSLNAKFDSTENHTSTLVLQLEVAQKKLESHELETLAFKDEIKKLTSNLDSMKAKAQSYEREAKIWEQEKNHLQEKYVAECKKSDDAEERLKVAERDAKRATELADTARAEIVAAQKEKSELQRLAMERLAIIERVERRVDSLEQEKVKLMDEVERLHQSEMDATSKVTVLERRVEEREKEIEDLLSRSNEQRSNTVQVLESLLATERAARAEANSRAEALSLQLQATQGRLDALHQELTSIRLNETALDSKLRTASQGKRMRVDNYLGTESVQDMEVDEGLVRGRKRSKSTTSPLKITQTEDGGSVYKGEDYTQSQEHQVTGSEDYMKFTILKLKQELTKHGFGGQLLQLRNPNKKEIVALYEKHVLQK